MIALRYLISEKCPTCGVSLFRVAQPMAAEELVFCSECGAGGLYKEVIKEGKALTPGFLTRPQIEDFLRQIRIGGE